MAAFLDGCRFNPTAGGTTDWTYSSAVTGYQSPAAAQAVNGAVYRYRAESADLSQWELGTTTYNAGTGVFARTAVLYNSSGSGSAQGGAGTKISFSTVPQVAIVALAEDLTIDNFSIHGSDIAAAATVNLDTATGNFVHVTGNTAISAITLTDGRQRTVYFTGTPILTNGASLVLPGGNNISVGAGDIAVFIADGTTVRCSDYFPAAQPASRSLIYAAPFDALAFNGMQVNGSMDVDQINAGALVSNVNGYAIDQVQVLKSGSMVLASQQVADAPAGLVNSLKVTVTTAEASISAADYAGIFIPIEGYRVARLAFGTANVQPVSIGFWTKINRTGTYSGAIRTASGSRSYPFNFTQAVSNTWQFNTVTIPGDTAGTWASGNTSGFVLFFAIASGTTNVGAAGAWSASSLLGVTGTTNGVAATSDVFQVTGVIVLPGIELPSSARAPLIMRPYTDELSGCFRYLYVVAPGVSGADVANGSATSATNGFYPMRFQTTMRSSPSLSVSAAGDWLNSPFQSGTTNQAGTAAAFAATSPFGTRLQLTSASMGSITTAVPAVLETTNASAKIIADARL